MIMVDTGYMFQELQVSPANFKRALVRSAPREFAVEPLPPTKHDNNWSYGVKVCPIVRHTSDTLSMSPRSSSSYSEYEIWRRWEDCLDFQETLEAEYRKMSLQKVKVLKRGATRKRREEDEPYSVKSPAAASFESLPEGPDPREIAVNVHDLIPQLTRKATLFRTNRNTARQRSEEFAAMIRALFNPSEEAPVLLQELRNCTPVRDFFGFWIRDKDIQKRAAKTLYHSNQSSSSLLPTASHSLNSSTFSTPTSPAFSFRHSMGFGSRPRGVSDSIRDVGSPPSPMTVSAPPNGRKSAWPSSPSSKNEEFGTGAYLPDRSIKFTDSMLFEDESGTNLEYPSHASTPLSAPPWGARPFQPSEVRVGRPPSFEVPEPIPEDNLPRPLPRPRRSSSVVREHRNARFFGNASHSVPSGAEALLEANGTRVNAQGCAGYPLHIDSSRRADLLSTLPSPTSSHSASSSSQPSTTSTTHFSISSSISSYAQSVFKRSSSTYDLRQSFGSDMSIELDLPFSNSPGAPDVPLSEAAGWDFPRSVYYQRDSIASFASGRTDLSADGVIPSHLRVPMTHRRRRSLSLDSPGDSGTPVMDLPAPSRKEESTLVGGKELSNFDRLSDIREIAPGHVGTPEMSMETPGRELPRFMRHQTKNSIGSISSTGSTSDSHTDDAFTVKALYRDSVVIFRAERSMPLAAIREKIRDRLALHESVPLDQDFVLAYLPSRALVWKVGGSRARSNSAASSTMDMSHLRRLGTEVDWQSTVTTCSGKVTLRVFDAETPA